jgi:hypothetical protein
LNSTPITSDVRYFTVIDGILECFVTDSVSTITVLDYTRSPREFADALQSASIWFLQVASGDIRPTPRSDKSTAAAKGKQD